MRHEEVHMLDVSKVRKMGFDASAVRPGHGSYAVLFAKPNEAASFADGMKTLGYTSDIYTSGGSAGVCVTVPAVAFYR
jgi:hypothetical protein